MSLLYVQQQSKNENLLCSSCKKILIQPDKELVNNTSLIHIINVDSLVFCDHCLEMFRRVAENNGDRLVRVGSNEYNLKRYFMKREDCSQFYYTLPHAEVCCAPNFLLEYPRK